MKLDNAQIPYKKDDRTIKLLEKLVNKGDPPSEDQNLAGLRTVQFFRSKAKGHVSGSEIEQLLQDILHGHETLGNHFRHVCTQVSDELEIIEQGISSQQNNSTEG